MAREASSESATCVSMESKVIVLVGLIHSFDPRILVSF